MLIVVLLLAVVGVTTGLALWTLRLPWPQRMRWLIASAATDLTGPAGPGGPLAIREVRVARVTTEGSWTTVTLRAAAGAHLAVEGETTLTGRAQLARWEAARTPLLLITAGDGESSLHGPRHAVTGMRVRPGEHRGRVPRRSEAA